MNLTVGKVSILDYIEDFNNEALKENESGVCIEVNDEGLEVALDDDDWSIFMNSNNAKFVEVKDNAYYYKCGDKMIIIPIAFVSEDECDTYLDVNNVLVASV